MRTGFAVGIVLLLLVGAFVIYSVAFKEWCDGPHKRGWGGGREAWGQRNYGEPPGDCVQEKSWLSF